ncbi:MAG: ethanolamine ammonia-lyase subunit EutC [Candidatus Thiodiazotropha sp.]|jgi:ethanolamine ammonia-lyase small subunit
MKTPFPTHPTDEPVIENPWASLRRYTDARIGLGRSGVSVPTKHLLEFQLAHAKAQDAVHGALDVSALTEQLKAQPWHPSEGPLPLHSKAADRTRFLQHPDYGRLLDEASTSALHRFRGANEDHYDLAIALVDGLSAWAIEANAIRFLDFLIPELVQGQEPWQISPLCIVEQGRVAIGDVIGELLQARCVLVLIGERPGLSSPDSMGLYMTWNPKRGRTDAQRNCISNIRAAGLSYQEASHRAFHLLNEARIRKLSGVQLKDRTDNDVLDNNAEQRNFLTDDRV